MFQSACDLKKSSEVVWRNQRQAHSTKMQLKHTEKTCREINMKTTSKFRQTQTANPILCLGIHAQVESNFVYSSCVCPGATCGTKQTATAQALLMSFTSTPMPKLIGDGDDWSHLFPKASVLAGRTPELCYKKFNEELNAMSLRCEQYNAEAHTRPFPECFPMYTNHPGLLECSISV